MKLRVQQIGYGSVEGRNHVSIREWVRDGLEHGLDPEGGGDGLQYRQDRAEKLLAILTDFMLQEHPEVFPAVVAALGDYGRYELVQTAK